jgi:cob(I)alamin adenosyltransferase
MALAKVTTRDGDGGYTGLLGSERVPKYDARIEALGAIDEATSALGLARAATTDEKIRGIVLEQQRVLYRLMAEVATTPEAAGKIKIASIGPADVEQTERTSEDLKRQVEIGNQFVIPGETLAGATLDVARTVVRRAERQVARLVHNGDIVNAETLRYLNRLSDLVFILARFAERGHSRGVV